MESIPQSPVRLLIADGDETLCRGLIEYFRSAHYTATSVDDADAALNYLSNPPGYDIALLDATLPGKNGFELLEEAQRLPIDSSFLLMSQQDKLEDRLRGYSLGVEDYIVKPVEMEELKTRVDAVLYRRLATASDKSHVYSLDDLTLNFASNTCFRDGQRIPLTALEFELLEYFVQNRGRVVSRVELRTAIWQDPDAISLRTIDRHVAKIRNKLEPDSQMPAYLQTVYGKGYEFADTEPVRASTDPVRTDTDSMHTRAESVG